MCIKVSYVVIHYRIDLLVYRITAPLKAAAFIKQCYTNQTKHLMHHNYRDIFTDVRGKKPNLQNSPLFLMPSSLLVPLVNWRKG